MRSSGGWRCTCGPHAGSAWRYQRRDFACRWMKMKRFGQRARTNTESAKPQRWRRGLAFGAKASGWMKSGPSPKICSSPSDTGLKHANSIFVGGKLKRFDPPDETRKPRLLGRQGRMPNAEDLRALVDAFETFLGFRHCFNRSDPEFFCPGRVQSDAHALPSVLHAK